MRKGAVTVVDYRPDWPAAFLRLADALRVRLDGDALRIDHIGSTAVPGLAGKDVIDIQVTIDDLDDADRWPEELLPGLVRRDNRIDHVPLGACADPREWAKRYWSAAGKVHLHVRQRGRLNQRYALLFRDYLRASPVATAAYGAAKRALADAAQDDWEAYCAVKDPMCDLIVIAAEQWAGQTGWG